MITTLIVALVIAELVATVPLANVNGSGLSRSDIDTNPEGVCVVYGDQDNMKDLCDWINVCDDTGEINSTDEFCTGEAVRYPPGRGGCPTGFHSVDDDESGLCYTNDKGCEYEGYIFRPDNLTCGEIRDVCQQYPEVKECRVTIDLSTPDNKDPMHCERSVPDYCIEPFTVGEYLYNGTWVSGTNVYCGDVNNTNFRVTIEDWDKHQFDRDFDGIGCESE